MVKNRNYYLKRISTNFQSGDSTYESVKELFVDNLSSMSVSCSTSDGMTTLANKILDIEPTVVADDLETSLTLTSSVDNCNVGDTIVLSSKVNVNIDEEDVDLDGYLTNASVKFYWGDTLLDTVVTGSDGVASYSYLTDSEATLSFKAVFDGTELFDECESSSVSVTVEEASSIEIVFNGQTITPSSSSLGFTGSDMTIDYGDGTIETTTGSFGHTYTDGVSEHTIKIYGVTQLGDSCFENISGIKSVQIPQTVTSIRLKCFYGCTNLTSISLPNISRIYTSCFAYCSNLTTITIPQSVTQLDPYAFSDCSSLTSITLPNNLEGIYDSVFEDDIGLTNITIPSSVSKLYLRCFKNCSNLATITFEWDDPITYDSGTYDYWDGNFSIPYGTTANYEAKGYPSAKLVERSE